MIATDGVFSMDGTYAPLAEICDLAERHDAIVMVDDSHSTGFVGETGRGTPELCGVSARIDIVIDVSLTPISPLRRRSLSGQ